MSDGEKSVQTEEFYSMQPIPQDLKKSWRYPASIYAGMCAVIAACMGGGGLISGLTLGQAIWALLIGLIILLGLFYIPLGKIGSTQGLNTYLIGEAAFGKLGSSFATALVITAIPCIGWYGIEVTLATQALGSVLNLGTAGSNVLAVIFGIIFALPAMYGILSMAWLNYVSLPVMFLIVIIGSVKALSLMGTASVWMMTPATNMGLMWGINLQIGMIVCGACFVADYTRWIKNKTSDVVVSGVVGILPFTILLTVAGMLMSLTASSLGVKDPWNIVQVMIKIGMPAIGLILIFLLQWTTCITAAYSSGLALKKVFGWSRFWWTLIAALLGTLLAITGIINYFLAWLGILAVWIPPAAGVIIAEYFFVSKRQLNRKEGIYWPGIISWAIAGLISWKLLFFIPAINGLVIAGVIYAVYHGITGTQSKKMGKQLVN